MSQNGTSGKSSSTSRRVAVVGAGVTGLAASWHLHENVPDTHVDVFEAEDRLGGHAYTMNVDGVDVDIGFMVYNHSNYPNMSRWFEHLSVQAEDSDMSLSVSLDKGKKVEWSSCGLSGLFARPWQLVEPSFYKMISDMLRFHKEAADILLLHDDDPRKFVTTGQFLRNNGYSEAFVMYYLLPMMAALWSASMDEVLDFPAASAVGFFCNHKMLQMFYRPQVSASEFLTSLFLPITNLFHAEQKSVENGGWPFSAIYIENEGNPWRSCEIVHSDRFHEEIRKWGRISAL